ncbi:hypothetical protein NDU88_001349 [Pleurodeles waltl]|uniref:Uncharacterized protein n=1 Tax=Pleurodeles waltl TaxID=8319 RepID=A0AAV7USJ5_PLEWA|nr:hypothetical protein NDU88_001349 [Pleurodeles waltl]
MTAQAVIAHSRASGGSKQARPPLEKGGELVAVSLKERTLRGASKMAASSVSDLMAGGALEERPLGAASKMAAPINIDEGEIVVISHDEEVEQLCQKGVGGQRYETIGDGSVGRAYVSLDVSQPVSGEGTSGCDTPHASGGHGAQAIYRPSGQMVGDQSLLVKVQAPSEHRPEGRVRSRAVRPTSRDSTGAYEAQPSTSQGAGAGWAYWDEDLLNYEEDLEEPVRSRNRVVVTGEVPGVVQGGHVPEQSHELSAGNLPRGEEGLVGFLRMQQGWDSFGSLSRARASKGMGAGELKSKVDASIQVSAVTVDGCVGVLTRCAPCGLWDTPLFAGQRSKQHHDILGGNGGSMVRG